MGIYIDFSLEVGVWTRIPKADVNIALPFLGNLMNLP